MIGRFIERAAVALLAVGLMLMVWTEVASAEGDGPTHWFVRTEVPETVPAALVEVEGGELMFCALQDDLSAVGILVDAVWGCEVAEVYPANAFGFGTVETSSTNSELALEAGSASEELALDG